MADELYCGHTACAGCPATIAIRSILKASGKNVIISNATSCSEIVSSAYPATSWPVPYIHVAFECAAAVAAGIESALKKLGKTDTKVIAIAGDGGTFDIGLQSLSGMVDRGHDVLYICYDNECYSNCLSLSSLVMTKHGLKKITEIKEGDDVYTFDLKNHSLVVKRCTGVFDNGKKEVFEIDTSHHAIKATENHPFLVVQRNEGRKKNELVWKNVSWLRAGDEIVVLKNIEHGLSYEFKLINLSRKGDYKVNKINQSVIPKRSSKELMELLGIYVGDGWTRLNKAETGFSIPENNRARGRIMQLINNIFKAKTSENKHEVYIQSINVVRFIDSIGFGKGAKNKTIPDWVFTLPKEERQSFVDGLMLSDGYVIDNSLRYTSASYELLNRLRLLLQTLDYRVGKIHWKRVNKGTICAGRALLKDCEAGYICFSHKKGFKNLDKYPSQSRNWEFLVGNNFFETEVIKSIKSCGIEQTLDLRVEDEHNFIANGIVVHNTGVQRSSATPFAAWTTTSPNGEKSIGNKTFAKPVDEMMIAQGAVYVATSSIGYPKDIQEKVKKALSIKGPKFLLIHAPCPLAWKFDGSKTPNIAKLAVETGLWAMYEYYDSKRIITIEPSFKPVEEYLKLQGRFRHITGKETAQIQDHVKKYWDKLKKQ